ncbi:MAG TPA: hypothetical protein VIL09_07450 [Microvirga sp.]|jgi:hypothetical protein
MTASKTNPDPGGQQPDPLASLEAAAEAGSKKPDDQGLRATERTSPKPGSLEEEEAKAAAFLQDSARKDTGAEG